MIEIHEMEPDEMHLLLKRVPYGHLGCTRHGRPYIVPIHFVFQHPSIFIYTTEGMKTEFMEENAEICLQAEEVEGPSNWRSVVVTGRAERITDSGERAAAMALILNSNPGLTPAANRTAIAFWVRSNVEVVYRIKVQVMSGRKAAPDLSRP